MGLSFRQSMDAHSLDVHRQDGTRIATIQWHPMTPPRVIIHDDHKFHHVFTLGEMREMVNELSERASPHKLTLQEKADILSHVLYKPVSGPKQIEDSANVFEIWDADVPEQMKLAQHLGSPEVERRLRAVGIWPVVPVFHSKRQSAGKKPPTHVLPPSSADTVLGTCMACHEKSVSACWNCHGEEGPGT